MSTWRERVPEAASPEGVLDWLAANYHYPIVALLMAFGFWLRTMNWESFVHQGTVLYNGNDPYYHLRSVQYAVENWPTTMPFDPWTNFAVGTSTSQFGTLFDQLIATAAIVLGLGSPSESLVRHVVLFAPSIFGVATFIPAYVIGRRVGDRFGGVIAVAVVAFASGDLFQKGLVGTADHHIAEGLFQAIAILGLMIAISTAETEKPVYELAADRAFGTMRESIGWSIVAGIALAMYLFVWPPGVFLLGVVGLFLVAYLSVEFIQGRSPEHVALVGIVAFATTGLLTLSTVNTIEIRATARSLLQPLAGLGIAAGCAFMAWLARELDDREVPKAWYPVSVLGLGGLLIGLLALLVPDTFGYLVNNVGRIFGLGYFTSQAAATVQEVQTMSADYLFYYYAFAIVTAVGGAVIVLYRVLRGDEGRGQELLAVFWMVFMLLAALTQVRFAYYITIPLATLNAVFAGTIFRYINRSSTDTEIETYQILTVGLILILIIAPMAMFPRAHPDASEPIQPGETNTVISSAQGWELGGGIFGWEESADWMAENTPVPGQYAAPGNDEMPYFGTFSKTDNFDYPGGAYGILSWWDYGHWITVQANRIPNANPFQQGADHAARFLLAGSESSGLAELDDRDEDDAKTRYVMIDWQIASMFSKGSAPISFLDDNVSGDDFYSVISTQRGAVFHNKQRYYDSMVNRLYHYHGSAQQPEPIVLQWRNTSQQFTNGAAINVPPGGRDTGRPVLRQFDTMAQAREYVAEAPGRRQIGGIGPYPADRVPALEHYRLVHATDRTALQSDSYLRRLLGIAGGANLREALGGNLTRRQQIGYLQRTTPSWTKTFERVPGAAIEGTGPANTSITAAVQLRPNGGANFTYRQRTRTDDQGRFNMTVPYATTGDDEWGVDEGYTDTAVRATGPYQLSSGIESEDNQTYFHAATVNVTEGQVLGEDDSTVTATLERQEFSLTTGGGDATDSGTGAGADGDSATGSGSAVPGDGSGTTDGGESGAGESGAEVGDIAGETGEASSALERSALAAATDDRRAQP